MDFIVKWQQRKYLTKRILKYQDLKAQALKIIRTLDQEIVGIADEIEGLDK